MPCCWTVDTSLNLLKIFALWGWALWGLAKTSRLCFLQHAELLLKANMWFFTRKVGFPDEKDSPSFLLLVHWGLRNGSQFSMV